MGIYRENLVIAIPAYNEEKRIINTIDSLKDYGKIIVFDNNSNDLTKKYVLNHGFDLMHTLKRGYENVIFDIVKFYLNIRKNKYLPLLGHQLLNFSALLKL